MKRARQLLDDNEDEANKIKGHIDEMRRTRVTSTDQMIQVRGCAAAAAHVVREPRLFLWVFSPLHSAVCACCEGRERIGEHQGGACRRAAGVQRCAGGTGQGA